MLFASWLYKDDELRDGKKLFPFVFSFSKMMLSFSKRMVSFRKVHWVFFSHSNFVLRSRKKTQWTFLQDNIILLQDNIFILRSWKKPSNISSSGQKRVWLSFETTSFCRRRKNIDKKILHPSVSQSSHDLLGNKKPLSHFSSGDHIYEGMLSNSPHAPLQYFLLPDEADFFSFLLNFKCRQWCFQQAIH